MKLASFIPRSVSPVRYGSRIGSRRFQRRQYATGSREAVEARREELTEFVQSWDDPNLTKAWGDSPIGSFWGGSTTPIGSQDYRRKNGIVPWRENNSTDVMAMATDQLCNIDWESFGESATKAVTFAAECIEAGDVEENADSFGLLLTSRFTAWKKRLDANGLSLRININSCTSLGDLASNGLLAGGPIYRELMDRPATTKTRLDGLDLDFHMVTTTPAMIISPFPTLEWSQLRFLRASTVVLANNFAYDLKFLCLSRYHIFRTVEQVQLIDKATQKVLWGDPAPVERDHLLKFGAAWTPSGAYQWSVYDINNIVQDSIDQYMLQNAPKKTTNPSKQSKYYYSDLIDPATVDPEWWIDSRRSIDLPLEKAFLRHQKQHK